MVKSYDADCHFIVIASDIAKISMERRVSSRESIEMHEIINSIYTEVRFAKICLKCYLVKNPF